MLSLYRICLVVLAAAIIVSPAAAASFDPPVKVVRIALPRDRDNPQARPSLLCSYYPSFMVKQIDLGEVGASQLSILRDTRAPCRRENAKDERVIPADAWSGYFTGAKSGFVFFDADDGWEDGMGFAVFTPDGKKVFDDARKQWRGIAAAPSGLTLRYTRVYAAKCSLFADVRGCWDRIRHDTGLSAKAPPDCAEAYRREQRRTPKFAKDIVNDPTVIDYDVTVIVDSRGSRIMPDAATALRCRPSE